MNDFVQIRTKNDSRKTLVPIERGRQAILQFGYRFIEWRSRVRRLIRATQSYVDTRADILGPSHEFNGKRQRKRPSSER